MKHIFVNETTADVYGDIGLMDCDVAKIELSDNAQPYCINAARKFSFPLLPKVKEELIRMLQAGIIEEVTKLVTLVRIHGLVCSYGSSCETQWQNQNLH